MVGRCAGIISAAAITILGAMGVSSERRVSTIYWTMSERGAGMVVIFIWLCVLDGRLNVPSR